MTSITSATTSNPIKRICALMITAFFLPAFTAAFAFDIPNQSIRYAVQYTSHDIGELEIVIENNGNTLKTTSITHLSSFAKLFSSEQTAENWFNVTANGVQVDSGQVTMHRGNKVTGKFKIDRNAGMIEFEPGDPEPTSASDMFEATGFPMVLMSNKNIAGIGGQEVREISPKRVRWYEYQEPQSETLELNGASYKTWKVTRNRKGNSERTQTFWLDPDNFHIPLKIVSVKDNKKTTYTLLGR